MTEASDVPVEDTVTMQVRSRLRELTLPLREELQEIDKRLVKLNRERDDLLVAKREITKTIEHLEPSQAKANGGTGLLAQATYAKKKAAIDEYIKKNRAKLAEGFTSADMHRLLSKIESVPSMSPSVTLQVVRELHQAGVLRADRIVRGGAQLYIPVGK